jgi:hypothetical protein
LFQERLDLWGRHGAIMSGPSTGPQLTSSGNAGRPSPRRPHARLTRRLVPKPVALGRAGDAAVLDLACIMCP